MSTKFWLRISLAIGLAVLIVAVGAVSPQLVLGQDSGENAVGEPAAPEAVNDNVGFSLPLQGRLTDVSGVPLNGSYDITFRFYTTSSGGTAVCSDTNINVQVSGGLFNTMIWGNCHNSFNGQQLYLGIEVGTDGEMTPRQPVYPVPYAVSLKPGAVISGTIGSAPILHIENSGTNGRGLRSYATGTGTNYGVVGASTSLEGYGGFFYNSAGGIGLWGYSSGTNHPAIFGCVNSSSANCSAPTNQAGIAGKSISGDGVWGSSNNSTFRGVYGENTGGGIAIAAYNNSADTTNHTVPTLYLLQSNASGDFVVGASSYLGSRTWRVDRSGKGYFNGGTQASGADFAEQIAVKGVESDYEVGDVLVISASADRTVEQSSSPFSTTVLGVYSSNPAVLAGAPDTNYQIPGIPVAVVGIVKCKVSAENGPIQRGDLLVTASLPGYAMSAGDNPPQGTVLGKALQVLSEGTGIILILVTLQ